MEIETFTLKKNSIIYRSSVDICKLFKKNLKNFKEDCGDTGKKGLYFSDSIMIPIGMSFEYLYRYNTLRKGEILSSFFTEDIKDTYFKNHQIGKFKVKDDIELYVGKYSYRKKELGGLGERIYDQEPTKNYNHIEKIYAIIDDNQDPIFDIVFENEYYEYFIGEDKDLEKIELIEVYDFNVQKFINYILRHKDNIDRVNVDEYIDEYVYRLPKVICEEDEKDGLKRRSKRKSKRRYKRRSKRKSKTRSKRKFKRRYKTRSKRKS